MLNLRGFFILVCFNTLIWPWISFLLFFFFFLFFLYFFLFTISGNSSFSKFLITIINNSLFSSFLTQISWLTCLFPFYFSFFAVFDDSFLSSNKLIALLFKCFFLLSPFFLPRSLLFLYSFITVLCSLILSFLLLIP